MCLFPVRAELQEFGKPKLDKEGSLLLPCGKCFECKSKRAVEWATRAKHEIALHDENCFLTLTYDEENLPSFLVVKDYFQKFMKRLRKRLKRKIRYMVSHEYGSKSGRPHHHCIIFGWNPPDQSFILNAPSGEPLFTSPVLDNLWPYGYHSIGTASVKSAYYIASYSLKSAKHEVIDDSGECHIVSDSMDCSKRPAIGKEYLLKHAEMLVQSGDLLPRYYLKVLERDYPDLLMTYENSIQNNVKPRSARELHAKYVINSQLEQESEYRTAPDKKLESKLYEQHLNRNRQDYDNYKRRTYEI